MRVWDVPPSILCRKHLLGEHSEIHIIYKTLITGRKAWSSHPETKRWRGRLTALRMRHDLIAEEMKRRSYNHLSPLEVLPHDNDRQTERLQSFHEQLRVLKDKGCQCKISGRKR